MSLPASRIGQLKRQSLPLCPQPSPLDVGTNRTDDRDNNLRLELRDHPAETKLAIRAGLPAFSRRELIHGTSAQINQIATQRPKRPQEVGILQIRKCPHERLSNGAIETGICLIEEAARGRRRLSDKEHPHTSRTKTAAQSFSRGRDCVFVSYRFSQEKFQKNTPLWKRGLLQPD